MKTYTIDPTNRTRLVRALVLRLALTFGAVLAVVIAIAAYFLSRSTNLDPVYTAVVMGVAVVALAVIAGVRLVQQVRDYQRGLESIQIDLGHKAVARRQSGVPDLRIARGDVIALRETEDGVLVMTKDRSRFLWLPAQLGDYAEAKARLATWMPITPIPPRPISRWMPAAWGVGTALCLLAMLLATQLWQVLVAGGVALAIYLYFYRLLRLQRHGTDRKFRRTYDGVLMFLCIVVLVKLLMTLSPTMTGR